MHETIHKRIRRRNQYNPNPHAPVLYWMERDQRVVDNWALYYAQQVALQRGVPLLVVFNLVPTLGDATYRHYDFMVCGLREVEKTLENHQIPFLVCVGEPQETIPAVAVRYQVGEVVTDQNPLRFAKRWREDVTGTLSVAFTEVDAHNIVPVWQASDKLEFAAHTIRRKIHRQLPDYLCDIPALSVHPSNSSLKGIEPVDWSALERKTKYDPAVPPVDWLTSGTTAGLEKMREFIQTRSQGYATRRNDPTLNALSDLSPYLHFGQISAQRVAYETQKSPMQRDDKEAFIDELVVRRELSDNFCFYNSQYDSISGAHEWAQKTLAAHRDDPREYIYTRAEFERGMTHDPLWNAMQAQMVQTGKMHGWCRMYWAKKILEWTNTPEYAIKVALYLNDRYELDGTDPNGVVGVMWSIAGVHDRAWTERPIFGKIRYMNYNGAKRKFDVATYIERYGQADEKLF